VKITHNNIDAAIGKMEVIVSKGQPFAKRSKARRIRSVLRDMRLEQTRPIKLKEVWFYFQEWLFYNLARIEKEYNEGRQAV